ncbi:MAG TPA: ABC transporter permease [Thermoanaerobacterales bacterium]|nr:ABC transporter permease [Thermoanaerobacterales bacterium]
MEIAELLIEPTIETIYMVFVATFIATIFGIPLGILLMVTDKEQILQSSPINNVLSTIVNVFRSIPFIILLFLLIPFTRFLVGKAIGTTASIVPLSIAAIPFMARLTETALREVDKGIIEAAQSVGASPFQIISKVLLPESLPSIVAGITITNINLVGYSAMAGAMGGGGLGDLAVRYGFQRFQLDVMIYTVIVLVVMVQLTQAVGDLIVNQIARYR